MKNSSIIIKIAFIVSAIASLFSIVTLIRAIIIKANIVLPIIQVVGSLAIFAICFIMFRTFSQTEEEDAETDEESAREDSEAEQAEQSEDEIEEKYHLSAFEEKKDKE
ncbi:MAG TPA: hypothetical protein DCY72_06860 [Ruminococcaceae bacterium]|nr:hypothetical protein [Oscillospiraceae bacterium]